MSSKSQIAVIVLVTVVGATLSTLAASGQVGHLLAQGSVSPTFKSISACPSPGQSPSAYTVAPGQFASAGEIVNTNTSGLPQGQTHLTVWSNSSGSYYLFIMNQTDFNLLGWGGNSTGPSQSTLTGLPQNYLWSSGLTTSAQESIGLDGGAWYIVAYNPGTAGITVNVASAGCGSS